MKTKTKDHNHIITFGKDAFKKIAFKQNKENALKVLIADDHPHLIAGLEKDLESAKDIKVIGHSFSYDDALLEVDALKPDIVLLDLKMPGIENHDLKAFITKIRAQNHCRVIIFSNETGWARIQRCLECGARGYIEKAISFGELAKLIKKVYRDDEIVVYTSDIFPKIIFSDRQKEVLHYLADGIENDEIALKLEIGMKSVQSYIHVIKSRLEKTFLIKPIRPRMLMFFASKLGFGSRF